MRMAKALCANLRHATPPEPEILVHPVFADLPTTIFEEMSGLARQTGAINLGQGFPDQPGPLAVRQRAALEAVEGYNQYPPMRGLAELRAAHEATIPAALA